MRREIPLAITFLIGIFMLVDFFVPHHVVSSSAEEMKQWGTIIIAASILLGVGNLIRVHFHKIRRRREGWGYSVTTLAIMVIMFVFGGPWGTIEEGSAFNWMFLNMQVPLQSTMFSLLAFFIASAAYRAFRLRSAEASLLLIAAIIVMLGRVPLGQLLTRSWPEAIQLPNMTEVIMAYPNMAAFRGILMGAALGVMAMGLRIILGIERSYLGGEK
ncbi:MAG: hypothetical protein U9Q95_01585 [Candidatus Eisenbacteria bacterium]|nr:hypothetical protein [Candidatus Eisenbacteria bacterium]